MIYMSFTWIVYISYITEGQIIVLKIHLKTCKVANTNKVTSHIRQVSSQFFLSFALWRVFVLDLGCTYSLYKCYHFLMGDLWKKWVTACQLSSKKQDLINITSWKRYWGKRLVKKKKNPHRHVKEGQGVVYEKSRRSIKIPFKCCIPRVNCTLSANSSMTGKLVWKKNYSTDQTCILGGDNISCFTTSERLTNENKL